MSDSNEIDTPTTGSSVGMTQMDWMSKKTGNMLQLLECCSIRQQIHKLMLHL